MFGAALTFMLAVTYAAAEIPSYIHVCGRRDPNINQCIANSMTNLKYKICEGMPELDVPRNDPIHFDELVIIDTADTKLKLTNAIITQACNFEIKNLTADIEKLHFDIKFNFKQIGINGTLDVKTYMLISIIQQGQIHINLDNVDAVMSLTFKKVMKNGKVYVYMSNIQLNLDFKDFDIEYNFDNEQSKQIREILNNFLHSYRRELITFFKPPFEKIVSKIIIDTANNIVKHFTYEELFPDRT